LFKTGYNIPESIDNWQWTIGKDCRKQLATGNWQLARIAEINWQLATGNWQGLLKFGVPDHLLIANCPLPIEVCHTSWQR
jgi:hypothetical protein